jgi:hypothetical protein
MHKIHQITSNQFYKGLNNRFQRRISLLHKFGFSYVGSDFGAVLWRTNPNNRLKKQWIAASSLSDMDSRRWQEFLADNLVRNR